MFCFEGGTMESTIIEGENLNVSYTGENVLTIKSLQITKGKLVGVVGPNGAGKSTLLKALLKLVPMEGEVNFSGKSLKQFQKKIAYVEQRSEVDLTFPISVTEVVTLGTYPKLGLFHRPKEADLKNVEKALKKVRLETFAQRQISQLSGGQLQRVFLARAIVQEAEIIFLDEPFVGIDVTSEKVIIELLKELVKSGKTIIVVHHDLHKVTDYFDEVIILNKQVIAIGPVEEVFTQENLLHAYGESIGFIQRKEEK